MMASLEASLRALASVVHDPGGADGASQQPGLSGILGQPLRYPVLRRVRSAKRRLSYVNAGHNPPVVLRNLRGLVRGFRLETGGPVIGLLPQRYQRGDFSHEPEI